MDDERRARLDRLLAPMTDEEWERYQQRHPESKLTREEIDRAVRSVGRMPKRWPNR